MTLTSKDRSWVILRGTQFTAIQKPEYPKPQKFSVDDSDLLVLYKGRYLELEKAANIRAFKQAKAARNKGAILGIAGSIAAAIASLLGLLLKAKFKKKK